jgi:heme-degrading monooxygenase HmoA
MPQVITVFRSRLRADMPEEYGDLADQLLHAARAVAGFVEHKVFVADDGERLTLVVFDSETAEVQWRDDVGHRVAQQRGRDEFYDEYDVAVTEVRRRRRWRRQV